MLPPDLPQEIKTILENLPGIGEVNKIFVYNEGGVIVHIRDGVHDLQKRSPSGLIGKNIKDLILPPLEVDADPELPNRFFMVRGTKTQVCLNTDILEGDFYHWTPLAFKSGIPCWFFARRIGSYYIAFVHIMDYLMERRKGLISQDMLAILNDRDEIKMVCPYFSLTLAPEPGNNKLFMHDLTLSPSWRQLVSREKDARDYLQSLLDRPDADWRVFRRFDAFKEGEWICPSPGIWKVSPESLSVDASPAWDTAFITHLHPLEQTREDVRIQFPFDLRAFTEPKDGPELVFLVGVAFHLNIYHAGSENHSPDSEGYTLSLRRLQSKTAASYMVSLKKHTEPVQKQVLSWEIIENLRSRGWVMLGFEKIGGAFRLTADGQCLAVLMDVTPLTSPHHNYFGFMATPGTSFRDIRIETRVSQFDPRRIPPLVADVEFPKQPGKIFEVRLGCLDSTINSNLRFAYMKDVTYSRELLKRLNATLAEIEDELNTAKRLQNLMTDVTLPKDPRIQFESFHKPSRQVGGDLFDVKDLGDGRYAVLIYDVSGHGIAASLLSAMAKMAFENAFKSTDSPAEIMARVNADLCKVTGLTMFVTAFLAVVDAAQKSLVFSRAGHCYPALFNKEKPDDPPLLLREGGAILGNSPEFKFGEVRLPLARGARILLYTDGLIELRDSQDCFLGQSAVFNIVRKTLHQNLEAAKAAILKGVRNFIGDRPYEDDLTFLFIDVP